MSVLFTRLSWHLAVLALSLSGLVQANVGAAKHAVVSASVHAEQAWIREVPPQSTVAAVFVELNNQGRQRERIVAMSSPLAERVEWHDMRHDNGRMEMSQRLEPELPAQSQVSLAPMASHLMLLGLKQPLRLGMRVPLMLTLASGQRVSFVATVRDAY